MRNPANLSEKEIDQTVNWLRAFLAKHFEIHLRRVRPDANRWYLYNEKDEIVGTMDKELFTKAALLLERYRRAKDAGMEIDEYVQEVIEVG